MANAHWSSRELGTRSVPQAGCPCSVSLAVKAGRSWAAVTPESHPLMQVLGQRCSPQCSEKLLCAHPEAVGEERELMIVASDLHMGTFAQVH